MNIRTDSTEFVKSTVTVDHDLEGKTISVALPPTGQPPVDWFNAEVMEVVTVLGPPVVSTATYRILLGPSGGAVELEEGTYDWTVRINDTPEVPVRKAGNIVATIV